MLDPAKVCIVWRSPFTLTWCCLLWKTGFQVFMSIHLIVVDQCSFKVSIICRFSFEDLRIEQERSCIKPNSDVVKVEMEKLY